MRISLNWWVLPRATHYEEFLHCDLIDIARVFVLPDEGPLVEGSIDVEVGAFLKFGRKDRQIPVEDQAEPIGVLSGNLLARKPIGLSKPSIRDWHGGGQIAQRGFRSAITSELKAILLHCLPLRSQIQAFNQPRGWLSVEPGGGGGCLIGGSVAGPRD